MPFPWLAAAMGAQAISQALPSLIPQQQAAAVNQEYGGVSHQRIGWKWTKNA